MRKKLKKVEIDLSTNNSNISNADIVQIVGTSTMYLSGMGSFCLIRTMRTMRTMCPVPATTASTGDIPIISVTRYAFYDLNTILHVF